MHKRVKRKKRRKYVYIGIIGILSLIIFVFLRKEPHKFTKTQNIEEIRIVDDGTTSYLHDISANNVSDVLSFHSEITEDDRVFPSREEKIFNGDTIVVSREKEVRVSVDGEEKIFKTFGDTISYILELNNVELDENDIVTPSLNTIVHNDINTEITRVTFEEEIKTKKIAFETITEKDDELNFLKKYTKQEGKNGSKDLVYRVAYHDGEEVDRELIEERITKEAVNEIIVQGTQVKLGKSHSGLCSWYSWTGTMAAANPWLPKGSYVKVTNKANGKSVIVTINDRGPFVPGRIIDLDKVAFEKIAPLGAGVIDVKMEEVIQ